MKKEALHGTASRQINYNVCMLAAREVGTEYGISKFPDFDVPKSEIFRIVESWDRTNPGIVDQFISRLEEITEDMTNTSQNRISNLLKYNSWSRFYETLSYGIKTFFLGATFMELLLLSEMGVVWNFERFMDTIMFPFSPVVIIFIIDYITSKIEDNKGNRILVDPLNIVEEMNSFNEEYLNNRFKKTITTNDLTQSKKLFH